MGQLSRHQCIIYDGAPSVHLPLATKAIVEQLKSNYRCLYLNSPPMIAGLRSGLAAAGLDVSDEIAKGGLVLSSEQDHLTDGEFDVDGMLAKLANAVEESISDGYAGLWASGDMLWEFGTEKNLPKLLAYEVGLEALLEAQPALCGICQYHREVLPESAVRVALYTHRTIYVNETLSLLNPHCGQLQTLRAGPEIDHMLDRLR